MINTLIEAISTALYEEFGYEIHMEEIAQGLEEPCFYISCLEHTSKKFPGERSLSQYQFCIQYFPETTEKQRECNSVSERMEQCLEYIMIDGEERPLRGTKMKHNTVNGVLNFFVDYDFFLYQRREKQESMENLETSINVEGDE